MAATWALSVFACAPAAVREPAPTSDVAADLAVLTSRRLDGRAVGTAGGDAAALFIAQRYVELGVPGAFPSVCVSAAPCGSGLFQLFQIDGLGAKNVLAALPGTDASLRGHFVVLGAHFDHLGRSPTRSLDPERKVRLRPGADDNASGTAALLELARRLALEPAPAPVLFAHFDAEEIGLLGSREFLDHPSVPHESMALMVNLDMVGRLGSGPLQIELTPPARQLESLVDSVARALGVPIRYSTPPGTRSDHHSFSRRGIPAIWLFTGRHGDYHKTTDTAERLDLIGIGTVVDLAEALVRAAGSR